MSGNFENITSSSNRDMVDLFMVYFKKTINDVINPILLHFYTDIQGNSNYQTFS